MQAYPGTENQRYKPKYNEACQERQEERKGLKPADFHFYHFLV
jgi:hypothetical protein